MPFGQYSMKIESNQNCFSRLLLNEYESGNATLIKRKSTTNLEIKQLGILAT